MSRFVSRFRFFARGARGEPLGQVLRLDRRAGGDVRGRQNDSDSEKLAMLSRGSFGPFVWLISYSAFSSRFT